MIYNLLCFKSKPTVKPYIIPLHLGTALAAWCASACRHVVSTWCAVDQGKGAVDEAGWTVEAAEAKGTAVEATEEEVRSGAGRVSMEKGGGAVATDRGRETVAVVKVVAMEEEGEAEVRVAVGRVASTEARAAVGRVAAREAAVRAVVTVVEAMVMARGAVKVVVEMEVVTMVEVREAVATAESRAEANAAEGRVEATAAEGRVEAPAAAATVAATEAEAKRSWRRRR